MAQGDARAVDLTQNRLRAGDFGDDGGFAETHLADALAKLGVALQGLNPPDAPSGELAKGKVMG